MSRVGYAAAVETKLHSRQRGMTDGGSRMTPPLPRLEVSREELLSLLEHARAGALSEAEYQQLKAALDTLVYLTQLVEDKNTTIGRLRQILFGSSSEKMRQVLETLAAGRASSEQQASGGPAGERVPPASAEPLARPGHGRNGAEAYRGAHQVKIEHASLKSGNRCPGCQKGKLYVLTTPGVLIRVVGQAPLAATVYELEKLRCNLCGEVFTAEPPEGVGQEKYDATAASMIALLKYGSGLPFHRLEGLQKSMEIPLPPSTQWEIVAETAQWIEPIYQELIQQAAQGEVLHNDDTAMKILALMGESLPRQPSAEEEADNNSERTGIFTSGIVSTRAGQKIALFFTGHRHAGENLASVLARRAKELGPPIQMCDALARNLPKEFQAVVANCIAHGRRRFVEVAAKFPRGMPLCTGIPGRGL